MKNRPRPHVPLAVRVQVAERQLIERHGTLAVAYIRTDTTAHRLGDLLFLLFAMQPVALDHQPPLRTRAFNKRTGKFKPDANDPDYLIYRTVEDHKRKTNQRGDGAQFPDRVLIKRERRREKKATPAPTRKIAATWNLHPCRYCGRIHANGCPAPSRPIQNRSAWPKGRKFQNRRFRT